MRARALFAIAFATPLACVQVIGGSKYHLCSDDGTCDASEDASEGGDANVADAAVDSCQGSALTTGVCSSCIVNHPACLSFLSKCRCERDCFVDIECAIEAGGPCTCPAKTDLGKQVQTCLRQQCATECACK